MLQKYNELRQQGWNHMAAAHAVISGSRNRAAVDLFNAVPEVVKAAQEFAASVKI